MKNLFLACFLIFSFEEAFSQTGHNHPEKQRPVHQEKCVDTVNGV